MEIRIIFTFPRSLISEFINDVLLLISIVVRKEGFLCDPKETR